ncbi:GTP-sensing pleiotropic transcriptional regulator CodY [Peptococcus simiae]|uniref:Global transcriptional regulator CodY n=1 Tax=Peptococcus simiae TaxID=1643805 RepID=A0ABW9GXF9_9FIRM
MSELLEKTRRLNKLLQEGSENDSTYIDFNNIADILSDMIECNTYILGEHGALLGHHFMDDFNCSLMEQIILKDKRMPKNYNDDLINTDATKANVPNTGDRCFFSEKNCDFGGKITTVIPIVAGKRRQGTLLLAKFKVEFTDEDLVLAEYGATIVGIEIMRSKVERDEAKGREKAAVQIALDTLSYSEMEAIEHIFNELDGEEGLLVASKIADRVGITRSVIVNALRKFESAGVIESKSLGMKGTYIRVLNEFLLEGIAQRTSKH